VLAAGYDRAQAAAMPCHVQPLGDLVGSMTGAAMNPAA
jgi:hypothetical protein